MRRAPYALVAVVLFLSSCGSDGEGGASRAESFDREIRITTTDALRFEPATLTASPGETVKFVIRNDGRVDHEFAIGSSKFQSEMAESAGGHGGGRQGDTPDAGEVVEVSAGETATLVYTMPDDAPTYACHVDRHDRSGMTGTVTYS